jgi:hypothetical protein
MNRLLPVIMILTLGWSVQGQVIWQADFDTYTLTTTFTPDVEYVNTLNGQYGWWKSDAPTALGEIVSENGHHVARIGSLYGNWFYNECNTPIIQNEPTNMVLSIEFDFYRPGTGNYSDQIQILGNNQNGAVSITFDRTSQRIIVNQGFTQSYDIGSFTPGANYSFVVYKDDIQHTFSLKLNGSIVLENVAWESWVNAGIYYISIKGGGNVGPWVDNSPYTRDTNRSYFGNITVRALYPFNVGWYGRSDAFWGSDMADDGANITLVYNMYSSFATLDDIMSTAASEGLKVILQLPRAQDGRVNSDPTVVTEFVQHFDWHPALYGWYIADEPDSSLYTRCKSAYDTIKLSSTKPVTMVFCQGYIDCIDDFADAYDILLFDKYPGWNWISEFGNLESWTTAKAKSDINNAATVAGQLGKPWMIVLQGFGNVPSALPDWRLPTWGEERFLLYYAIDRGAKGWLTWCQYYCKDTIAVSDDPYPYNGNQWILDVYRPLVAEIDALSSALAAGRLITEPLSGISRLSDDSSLINSSLWQDPDTGEYYILAVNLSPSSVNATFKTNYISAILVALPLFENRSSLLVTNSKFTDSFTRYQVHIYQLIRMQ